MTTTNDEAIEEYRYSHNGVTPLPSSPLSPTYHERVVLDFLIYTMRSEVRRQLMNTHPASYDIVVRKQTQERATQ